MIPLNNILKGFTILLITFFNYPYYYTQTILENGGFEASPERTPGTYSKYNSLDDKIDDFIIDYLSDNFIIQDHYWRYLGKKIDGDFTLFFLEIDKFDSQSDVAVFNTIFMDMYSKQKNIMNVYGAKSVQSSTMTIEEPAFKFEF